MEDEAWEFVKNLKIEMRGKVYTENSFVELVDPKANLNAVVVYPLSYDGDIHELKRLLTKQFDIMGVFISEDGNMKRND